MREIVMTEGDGFVVAKRASRMRKSLALAGAAFRALPSELWSLMGVLAPPLAVAWWTGLI